MLRVFVGYDRRETVAFHVLAHSIMRRASVPVSITGLMLPQLPMTRPRDPRQSTDFAFSRFLVPHLCGFDDRAVFMDCDMLCRGDIYELFRLLPREKSVAVVKHEYIPTTTTKFLGQAQVPYPRKNWSSVMVFNCAHCRILTPDYVNAATGLELHRFAWTHDDAIASLPPDWNHLVGEYPRNPGAKIAHFTLGSPCFAGFEDCEFAQEWRDELSLMTDHA